MGLSDTLSEGLSNFEKYNNKEIYRIGKEDSFNFVVTGRLVSAAAGFFVIIIMLILTFSSAANSYQVAELGGVKAYTADVIISENSGPSFSGSLNSEGEFVEFGHIVGESEWDYTSNMRISHFEVVVDWSASGGGGGGRQVSLEASSENNTAGESQNGQGNGGTITILWPVNQLPEIVSSNADNSESFLMSYETEGEWMGGKFTYISESTLAVLNGESIDYTITLIYYTWEFDNIREIAEV